MKTVLLIFSVLIMTFMFFNCQQRYPAPSTPGSPNPSGGGGGGFQPTNTSTPNPPPSGATAPGCDLSNQGGGDWGGVTCVSNSNRDQSFREFLSSGTLITGGRDNLGTLGEIDCQPNNEGGILFRIHAVVGENFNPNGGNPNLQIQSTGTALYFHITHRPVNSGQESAFGGPITAELRGVNGNINGNRATMAFEDEAGSVTLDGRFDINWYEGTIQYQNRIRKCANSDSHCRESNGYRGTLGQFRIPTCKVFFSNVNIAL